MLEDRLVPSLAIAPPPPIALGQHMPLPAQAQPRVNPQASAAFATFLQSYSAAVDSILLAPDADGTINPSANRAAFDAAVEQALETLANDLVASLGSVSPSSPLATQVVVAILGDSPDSLKSQLMALSTTAIEQGASARTVVADATQATRQASALVADLIATPSRSLVAQGTTTAAAETAILTIKLPTAAATRPSATAVQEVRGAFGGFLNEYYRAVRDVLLAPGPGGTVDPAANRVAFDARVNLLLQSLADSLARSLRAEPSATALITRVQTAIAGDGSASLQGRLASLPTPASPEAAAIRDFTLGSFRAVIAAFARVTGDASPALAAALGAN
jgi:hypothetical protein